MAAIKVIAKLYDIGQKSSTKLSKPAKKVFENVLTDAVAKDEKKAACNCEKQSTEAASKSVNESQGTSDDDSGVGAAVSYSFSVFMRVSEGFGNIGESVGHLFNNITRKVLNGIQQQGGGAQRKVNNYLGNAQKALAKGDSSASSFIKQMSAMHQNSLQSMIGNQGGKSFLSGFNMSTDSALPGTSGSDIARLYLSAAASGTSSQGGIYEMSGAGVPPSSLNRKSSGLKIVSEAGVIMSGSTSDASEIQPQSVESTQSTQSSVLASDFINRFMSLFDKFMGEKHGTLGEMADAGKAKVSVNFGFNINRLALGIDGSSKEKSEVDNQKVEKTDTTSGEETITA